MYTTTSKVHFNKTDSFSVKNYQTRFAVHLSTLPFACVKMSLSGRFPIGLLHLFCFAASTVLWPTCATSWIASPWNDCAASTATVWVQSWHWRFGSEGSSVCGFCVVLLISLSDTLSTVMALEAGSEGSSVCGLCFVSLVSLLTVWVRSWHWSLGSEGSCVCDFCVLLLISNSLSTVTALEVRFCWQFCLWFVCCVVDLSLSPTVWVRSRHWRLGSVGSSVCGLCVVLLVSFTNSLSTVMALEVRLCRQFCLWFVCCVVDLSLSLSPTVWVQSQHWKLGSLGSSVGGLRDVLLIFLSLTNSLSTVMALEVRFFGQFCWWFVWCVVDLSLSHQQFEYSHGIGS